MPKLKHTNRPTRVLITGGAGFVGSHLAEGLIKQGHHVTIIDDLSTGGFENIQHLVEQPHFRFAIDNVNNEVVLDRLVSECSVIFHLAAAVGVRLIVDKPIHTIETNVMGTEAVLRAALRYRVKVLLASSSEVYGKGNDIPFREGDDVVLGPTCHNRWSYAASKMVDEFLALAYYREKGLPVVIFRLFNTVGPRQTGRYGMVIPRFVQQAMKGELLTVYGDGLQSRCFLHVYDAVKALIDLAEYSEAVGEVFNIGSTNEVTILELAHGVLQTVETTSAFTKPGGMPITREHYTRKSKQDSDRIVFIPYEEAYTAEFEDMRRRVPDISKIQRYIGWEPSYSLEGILRDVITSAKSA